MTLPTLAALALLQTASASEEMAGVMAHVAALRQEIALVRKAVREQGEAMDGLKQGLGAVGEEVSALKERVPGTALPFLAAPPPSTDTVGVAKVAVFAPRIEVDAPRRHDLVSLRVRRVEAGVIRSVGEVELGRDELGVDLPLDQNGGLYIVDWATSEGWTFALHLRDGAGRREFQTGREDPPGPSAAAVQVRPLQNQGRFIFVGYRVD